MANEVTTAAGSAGELVAAEIVSRLIIDAAYAEAVMPPLVRVADISAESTLTVEFPKWPLLSASDLTEGTDASNTAVDTASVSVPADEAGIMITVTDMLLNSTGLGGLEPYAAELGKALANKIDTDLLAEVADFTNSVGSTGVDITESDFLTAIYTLEAGNAVGPFVAVLHPVQVHDLRTALASTTGAIWGGPSVPAADLGAFASLYGVDVFKSTSCASVNTDADRQGVMMPMGNQSGLAYVLKTGAKTEFQRDASLRATEIVVTAIYGDECVNTAPNGGVAIITDHE
ncbi:MAG: phage major capsid protein [Thermodesulfobacteriota bacterium]